MSTRPLQLTVFTLAALVPLGWSQEEPQLENTRVGVISPAAETDEPVSGIDPASPAPSADSVAPPPGPSGTSSEVIIKDDAAGRAASVERTTGAASDRLSVDFPEEDIRNILRNVADLFELNLVLPESLQGRASIKLRDVTWRQIFQEVLNPIGYTFRERENIISVVSLEQMKAEQETIIIPVTSGSLAEAKQAADSIVTQPLVGQDGKPYGGGRVLALPGASSLQVTDTPEKIAEVRSALSVLSKANAATNTRQVLIETKFYDVTETDAQELGVRLDRIAGVNGGTLRIHNNANVPITGTPFTSVIYDQQDFVAALAALQRDDRIKLVTNPLIVTQQNRKAEIFEKTTIRYFVPVPQAQNAVPSPPEIKELEVKTGLTVTPSIIDSRDAQGRIVESLIQMQVTPEVSSLGQNDVYSASGVSISIPRVNSRSSTTNVVLKNGYTLALGGLVKTEQKRAASKTPLLGDIPGLGILFRRTDNLIEERTLLTFITARIVTPDGSLPESATEGSPGNYNAPAMRVLTNQHIRALDLTQEDLPGHIDTEVVLPSAESVEQTKSRGRR